MIYSNNGKSIPNAIVTESSKRTKVLNNLLINGKMLLNKDDTNRQHDCLNVQRFTGPPFPDVINDQQHQSYGESRRLQAQGYAIYDKDNSAAQSALSHHLAVYTGE